MEEHHAQDVILHASDEPAAVQHALDAAARIVAADLGVRVRVIVNGGALTGLTGAEPISPPRQTEVAACEAGMAARRIDASDLRPGVLTVPSAVVAIVQAQLGGSAYVRI